MIELPQFDEPPRERADAARNRERILVAAAAPGGKEGEGPHSFYATHLAILLTEAAPQLDARFTAETLLATLAPAHHLRMRERYSLEEIVEGWGEMVQALTRR